MISRIISRQRFRKILQEVPRYYAGIHQRDPLIRLPTQRLNDLKQKLADSPLPSEIEWSEIRKSILDERRFTATNVDSTVLGLCNTLEKGKSYVEYLRTKGIDVNMAIICRLLRLYRLQDNSGDHLSEQDQQDILKIYADLRKENAVLDPTTCANLIGALTLTKHWRESFELLNMIKLTGAPDSSTYNYIIQKCFLTGDHEMGWTLLKEQTENKRLPNDYVFMAWLEYSLSAGLPIANNIEKMLSFTSDSSIFLSKNVGAVLKQLHPRTGITAHDAKITEKGKCSHCKSTLASIVVQEHSFRALKDAFLKAVIIKKEIFNKTTPEELQRFQLFIDKTKPYDVVIDGLNVAFSTGNQKSPAVYATQIAAVVKHYVQQKKRVLVIGREHMGRWQSREMKYIRQKSLLFLTEDLSQDDPFLLYAALESGPQTDFFSRDLMRKHSFLLGSELGTVFKQWQQQHQYALLTITPEGKVLIKSPFQYELYAHRLPGDSKRWHVPLVDDCQRLPKVEKQANWLCLKID
ncbi:mitochondrial ribonuclease P catalytic subunit [Topomyia yanbarensis]|uniref:mitochondrial ribonuclease P catalytic subunit n=1 Tax=Topomyia yanbarensis TaxID=2498891 RepID=UPI00273C738D|nr:mitochondrial ribonuclease P catalytic subunit [Topomyia yanbarensis]